MSRPASGTLNQNIRAPTSAIPAQSAPSRVSSWAKGPPAFTSSSNSGSNSPIAAGTSPVSARSPSLANGGPRSGTVTPTHSRKPSALAQTAPANAKEVVTLPRNVPSTKANAALAFGSISDENAQLSSSPANVPPISEGLNVTSFGSVTAEPSSSTTAPVASKPPTPSATDAPVTASSSNGSVAASTPPVTKAKKNLRRADIAALFQGNNSTTAAPAPEAPSSSAAPVTPSPGLSSPQRPVMGSPAMSPAPRNSGLPGPTPPFHHPLGPPNGAGRGGPPQQGARSPQLSRAQPNNPNTPSAMRPLSVNGGPQGSPQPQPQSGPNMGSPRVIPGQPQQMMYYPHQNYYQAGPSQFNYYMPSPAYGQDQWMYSMSSPPMASSMPHQGAPQHHPHPIPPHAQSPNPITNSPRPTSVSSPLPPNAPLPASPSPHPHPQFQAASQSPAPHNQPLPVPGTPSRPPPSFTPSAGQSRLSNAAPSFQPRPGARSSAIVIKKPDGSALDITSPKKTTPSESPSRPPPLVTHSRSSSAAITITSPLPGSEGVSKRSSIRIETPRDHEERLAKVKEAEDEKKVQEQQEKAKAEAVAAEAAAAKAKAAEDEAKRVEEQKAKEEEEKRIAEEKAAQEKAAAEAEAEAQRQRQLAAEQEKARVEAAAEAERLQKEEQKRREAEAEAKARSDAEKAAAEAEKAREADVAAAAAKAEAERAEAERITRERKAESLAAADVGKDPVSSTPPISKRPIPSHLDLSVTTIREDYPSPLPSALASARNIEDINKTAYPKGILSPNPALNVNAEKGKFRYDREFMVQFMALCQDRPDSLPDLDALGISRGSVQNDTGGRPARNRQASLGPRSSIGPGGFGPAKAGFGMGNFQAPKSSEARFAAATMSRGVSVGSAAAAGMRGPSLSRSTSQGGAGGMVPPSPKEQMGRTRSGRGGRRREANQSISGFNSPATSLSTLEPFVPLEVSENRWVPVAMDAKKRAADGDAPEVVERKVKALLNKLTLEKFDKLSDQIIEWANKSEREDDGQTLIHVIKLVFEKATDEAAWSEMYAKLCRKMSERISDKVQDKSVKNVNGEPVKGGPLFRKYLLNRCQEDFERGWAVKEATQAAAAGKASEDQAQKEANDAKAEGAEPALYSEEYYAAEKAKRQGLGLVKFIGELFRLQMLSERIMHECIKRLLSNIDNPAEEDIESLCRLLTTVGQTLDTPRARDHMNVYFSRMKDLAQSSTIASRIQFMLQDVIEMRSRNWQARKLESAPKTIAQVHADAAKADAAQQAYARQGSMSRGGSRRGQQREDTGADGWNVAGPSPSTRVQGTLSKFGQISKTAASTTSNPFVNLQRSGKQGTPPMSRTASSANMSIGNKFGALVEGDAAVEMPAASTSRGPSRKPSVDLGGPEPAQRKRLQLAPRTLPIEGQDAQQSTDGENENEDEAESNEAMTAEQADVKIKEDIKEFWAVRNLDEALYTFKALPEEHRHRLVTELANSALDRKEDDVKLVESLFAKASDGDLCSESTFESGIFPVVEFVDDLSVDVPKAYSFVARLLKGSRLSRDKVEALAGKINVEGDPLVHPSQKLLKELDKLSDS